MANTGMGGEGDSSSGWGDDGLGGLGLGGFESDGFSGWGGDSTSGGRGSWFGGLGDSYDFGADVLGTAGLQQRQSKLDGKGEPAAFTDKIAKAYTSAQSLIKAHPVAYALGMALSLMSPLAGTVFTGLPGLLFAGAADEFGKARAAGFEKTIAAGLQGLDTSSGLNGEGERADVNAAQQATAATAAAQQQNNAAAAGSGSTSTTGATPESAAASAAAEARRSARQRQGLMAMRITNPWAMLTDAATVFRPGVFA